ncbi:hemerythrin domain-containing protein [Winogradskyella schleiferi]|uniref:hemerythrin domain-containing protein n=1 Tax=Winogradskyella schleiferi TaxID=2686078 RepID=UPI00293B8945|nr:hemerythrin domain-containing protein [Winogradskyella schleiferi]
MQPKPQKRHKALQPLSREHHHGLLLCWKIKIGFSKNIEPKRIRAYANWFFENHLIPHFEMEETHIFPILNADNDLIKRALVEHRRLKRLFEEQDDDVKMLNEIKEELD